MPMRNIPFVVLVFLFQVSILCIPSFALKYPLCLDGARMLDSVPHFWSRCVGTGGADLCLKKEWKNAARIGAQEAGFKAVRGHGTLNTLNIFKWNGSGEPTYNWASFDSVYDFLIDSLNMHQIVELSFCPADLAAGKEMGPPKDYTVWKKYINAVVRHCIERYGLQEVRTWYWEVWNEFDWPYFWSGTKEEYYTLYRYTVAAVKEADSLMQVGGPASMNFEQLDEFISFCATNNLPCDFISNHSYIKGEPGPAAFPSGIRDDNRVRSLSIKKSGKKMASMNTEYNTSWAGPGGKKGDNCYSMDSHVNASFVAKCIKLILDDASVYQLPDVLSYWTLSDVFDEGSFIENSNYIPFGQVFGMITYQGVRKSTFNAFKMLHMMGNKRVQLNGGSKDSDGIDGFATVNGDTSEVAVLVYNYYDTLRQAAIDTVALSVASLPFTNGRVDVVHYRIDSLHSNPYSVWQLQGKPAVPTDKQWQEMHDASRLAEYEPVKKVEFTRDTVRLTFALPRQSVSLLMFKKGEATTKIAPLKHASVPSTYLPGLSNVDARDKLTISYFSLDGRLKKKLITANGHYPDIGSLSGMRGVYLVRIASGNQKMVIKRVYCR